MYLLGIMCFYNKKVIRTKPVKIYLNSKVFFKLF